MITSVTVIRQITACNSTLMEVNRLICFILRGRLPTKTLSQLPADRRALRRHCEDTRPTSLSFWSNPTHGMLRRRQTRGTRGHVSRWNAICRAFGGFAALLAAIGWGRAL